MSFMSSGAPLPTAGTFSVHELPMPAWAYGACAFAAFLVLLGVLWTFRHTAAKYDTPIRARHDDSGDLHGSPGTTDPGAHH